MLKFRNTAQIKFYGLITIILIFVFITLLFEITSFLFKINPGIAYTISFFLSIILSYGVVFIYVKRIYHRMNVKQYVNYQNFMELYNLITFHKTIINDMQLQNNIIMVLVQLTPEQFAQQPTTLQPLIDKLIQCNQQSNHQFQRIDFYSGINPTLTPFYQSQF